MEAQRRKELKQKYQQSKPPMGVLAFRCKATGESFLVASKNIPVDITSITFKLNSGYHPNKKLLALWNTYGEDGFETDVLEHLEYKDDVFDYAEDLETLREMCLENNPSASKLWK